MSINSQWHTLSCVDCNATIAFSFQPIQLQQDINVRCYLCAHVHAQVANWLMPTSSSLSTNYLYGVSKSGSMQMLRLQFEKTWVKLYAKLEQHRVVKLNKKLHANEDIA